MARTVHGAISVRKWHAIIRDPHSPFHDKLKSLYGDGSTSEPAEICRKAVEAFGESYGWDRDVIIVRSTGRINLMGMHIDHRGGSVNPIAIKEMFMVAEARDDDSVVLRDVYTDKFKEETFRIRDCLPEVKIKSWDAWCHDELEKRKTDPSITWSNYVRSAVLYLQSLHTRDDGMFEPALRGMNVMFYSSVPRAAGLSSSSSIVVASACACMRINDLHLDPMEFIDVCGYGEWYVGTRGGSGDHAAILFGKRNAVLHINNHPFAVKSVPFPDNYRIVLANSLVKSNKRVGTRDAFNNRVASYIFGLMLARENFPHYAKKMEQLRDINPNNLCVDEAEIYRIVRSLPESANRKDVLKLLSDQKDEVLHVFRSHTEPKEGYKIRQVCMYGITECIRAEMAVDCLNTGDIERFGELINISHNGDRVTKLEKGKRVPAVNSYGNEKIDRLIDDLESDDPVRIKQAHLQYQPGGYDVSVPEIDELVDISLDTSGVVGAGLVGAGLGGSMVAIVTEQNAQQLIKNMASRYYHPRKLPVRAEIVAPVGGAGVLDL